MKHIYVLLSFPLLMTSCNLASLGTGGLVVLFALLFGAMAAMFFFVAKRKKKAENTASGFSREVREMLSKISDPQAKIIALEQLIERINTDSRYKKDTSWRDKVLSKVYQQMASVYYSLGDEGKVIDVCTQIIALEPAHMMSYYNRGTLYGNHERYDEAIKDLTEAIDLDSNYANGYNNRGLIHHKMGEYAKAAADFEQAIQLDPTPISYYNRGNAYAALGDKEKALADYRKALSIDLDDHSGIAHNVQIAIDAILS